MVEGTRIIKFVLKNKKIVISFFSPFSKLVVENNCITLYYFQQAHNSLKKEILNCITRSKMVLIHSTQILLIK